MTLNVYLVISMFYFPNLWGEKDLNEPWEGFFKGNPMNSFCKTTFKAGGSLLLALQGPHNLMTVLLLVDGLLCGPGIAQLCF